MASSGTTSNTMRFTGAQLVVHLLERQGITMVSGIPGGSIPPIYDALSQSTQDFATSWRAMSRARALSPRGWRAYRRQAGGLYGLQRPGGDEPGDGDRRCPPGFDSAGLHHRPGTGLDDIGTDAFQEVDTYGISIPITKHNYLVRDIAELPQVISDAFRIAQSGRPGPVWIDIPKDVQSAYH